MKKLTRDQIIDKAAHVKALSDAHDELTAAREKLREEITNLHGAVDAAESAYNSALDSAKEFAAGIASEARDAFDNRSEGWQESEAGQTIGEWISEWEDFDGEDSCIGEPELEEAPEDASETLDGLRDGAS